MAVESGTLFLSYNQGIFRSNLQKFFKILQMDLSMEENNSIAHANFSDTMLSFIFLGNTKGFFNLPCINTLSVT